MNAPEGFKWSIITRGSKDHMAHLIPDPLVSGARTMCGEAVDPFHVTTESIQQCWKCQKLTEVNS